MRARRLGGQRSKEGALGQREKQKPGRKEPGESKEGFQVVDGRPSHCAEVTWGGSWEEGPVPGDRK